MIKNEPVFNWVTLSFGGFYHSRVKTSVNACFACRCLFFPSAFVVIFVPNVEYVVSISYKRGVVYLR